MSRPHERAETITNLALAFPYRPGSAPSGLKVPSGQPHTHPIAAWELPGRNSILPPHLQANSSRFHCSRATKKVPKTSWRAIRREGAFCY